MKILAVVPIYNPDPKLLQESISSYIAGVDKVLVWRNCSYVPSFPEGMKDKVVFCGDGTNAGIPAALNYAWKYACEHGHTHLLTMDQDSVWEDFPRYVAAISSPDAPKKAFFGPEVLFLRNPGKGRKVSFEKAPNLITSGMLLPLEIPDATHGWSEEFKVDGVDMEFSYHARNLGHTPYHVRGCGLIHHYGEPHRVYILGGLLGHITAKNYSPKRLYDMIYSHRVIIRRYPKITRELKRTVNKVFVRKNLRAILLIEKDKKAKISAIFRALRDSS